mmetsp:Transcript_10494/g.32288  ORF Transcript_10494/g.32288 Transcript_10494/m.32288 type:complete len:144 (+) Transcript_10494:80-511(+)
MSASEWHGFVARYFALGIALRRAICIIDYDEDKQLSLQGGRPIIPELSPEQVVPMHERGKEYPSKEFTSDNVRECWKPWVACRQLAVLRRDERRNCFGELVKNVKFWDRPRTEEVEQKKTGKKKPTRGKKNTVSRRKRYINSG